MSAPTSAPTSAASEMTVDRKGDGGIREELESLDGRLEGSDGQHVGQHG